jgi:hypothetical protein
MVSPKSKVTLLAAGATVALGLRVLYLFVRYVLGSASTPRFHVESAALIFVACGVAFRLTRIRGAGREIADATALPMWTWLVFCGLALALYWPALSVGFLSDDFVLVSRASNWRIGPVHAGLFRPLPLLVWAVLFKAGAGARTLHLVNVLLHGTNAYLTTRVVKRWLRDRRWSLLAGLLVLTAPLAPEAVVWCSGVFDLLATTLALMCVLIARRYDDHPSRGARIGLIAVGLAAVASKETAAVAVGLVLVDAWARRALSRTLLVDVGILAGVIGVFSVARLASTFGLARPPVNRYLLQHALFGSFGSFAVPWHVDVIHDLPWLPIAGVVIVISLSTLFFVESASTERTRLAVAAAVWVLLPIVPVLPIFFVTPDLQASRYLYLPAIGWAALVVVVVASEPTGRRYVTSLSTVAVFALIVIAAYGTVLHLQPWTEARRLRDRVEAAALATDMNHCSAITLSDLPDSVTGAYVFRNGGAEAFASDVHLNATVDEQARGPCSFRWNDDRLSFVPATNKSLTDHFGRHYAVAAN